MKLEDFCLRKDDCGNEFLTYSEGITKTRQSGLHEKHRLTTPKMFETNTHRCPVALFKLYISKRPVNLRNCGPFYLSVIINPTSQIWFKTAAMGINTINTIMKKMIENSPLNIDKRITNHSARKTLVKKLKKHQLPKSDIITITGHNTEAGLDAYDSGDEVQQKIVSFAIDSHRPQTTTNASSSSSQPYRSLMSNTIVSPQDTCIKNPTFDFFPQQQPSTFNFNNCTVNFNGNTMQQQQTTSSSTMSINPSDSSQEI